MVDEDDSCVLEEVGLVTEGGALEYSVFVGGGPLLITGLG